ncbi:UNVERIFIED_CONTAM: hypothetical protein Sradi_1863700 [Sesamum radiatum]|uniref:Vacuolar protein sorting-associated protein 13 second N-terminal domain-containing protein n=1 Tax=Sesamum radiatum TaxID=300843 RepID=A0AAW2TYE7_SESRA
MFDVIVMWLALQAYLSSPLIGEEVELERIAIYLDSDISPWQIEKPWEDLLPHEWGQSGYRDLLKLADNFTAFNQRLKYAHYRPHVSVKNDPRSWWKYACRAGSEQMKKASGRMPWEQVLRYARLRKKYISLYAALLKSDLDRAVVDDHKDIEELDRELDIDIILQWRMLAHKFVEQSAGSELYLKEKAKKSWWSFGWTSQPVKDENEPGTLTEEDWERLNDIIGYKEGDDEELLIHDKGDLPYMLLKLHMKHNASKLTDSEECLADLSCDNLEGCIKLYSEAKVINIKLGSYRLLSPNGLLAESESASDSLVGVFCYKPLDADVDWSLVAKASPCYVTYLKDSINQIINFFQTSATVSQTLVQETASAVQMTIDEVKRTAAKQVNRALKDRTSLEDRTGFQSYRPCTEVGEPKVLIYCLEMAPWPSLIAEGLIKREVISETLEEIGLRVKPPAFSHHCVISPNRTKLNVNHVLDFLVQVKVLFAKKRSPVWKARIIQKQKIKFVLDLDIAAPKITIPTDFYPDTVHYEASD